MDCNQALSSYALSTEEVNCTACLTSVHADNSSAEAASLAAAAFREASALAASLASRAGMISLHGHPLASAHVMSATVATKSSGLKKGHSYKHVDRPACPVPLGFLFIPRVLKRLPALGRSEDSTTARHSRDVRRNSARSVRVRRASTSLLKRSGTRSRSTSNGGGGVLELSLLLRTWGWGEGGVTGGEEIRGVVVGGGRRFSVYSACSRVILLCLLRLLHRALSIASKGQEHSPKT